MALFKPKNEYLRLKPHLREDAITLEQLVDQIGFNGVIGLLSEIAHDKAEHILMNWQDDQMAHTYQQLAIKLNRYSSNLDR